MIICDKTPSSYTDYLRLHMVLCRTTLNTIQIQSIKYHYNFLLSNDMLLLAYITQQYVKYFAVVSKKTIDYVKKN